jgi:hypothetical protein
MHHLWEYFSVIFFEPAPKCSKRDKKKKAKEYSYYEQAVWEIIKLADQIKRINLILSIIFRNKQIIHTKGPTGWTFF